MLKNWVITSLFILVGLGSWAQCDPANVTITDYCNNQHAEFTINDPDDNNRYQWFTDAGGTNSIGYGPGADGKYIYSPNTYASGSGPQDFWYQKQVTGVTGGPQSSTFAGSTSGNGGGRTNPITVDSDFDFVLNSITVPLHFWGTPPGGTSYGIKITMDGTTSNWYYFTSASLVSGGANLWFLNIPLDINGLGQGIPVTAGTGITIQGFSESDGTEAPGTSFLEFAVITAGGVNDTYTIGDPSSQLTIHQDSDDRTAWPTGRDGFFDWNITMKCPLEQVTANEEGDLSKCCVPVANQPTIITNTGSDIYETPITGTLTAGNSDPSHYFKWYKDGVVFSEGLGMNSVPFTDLGKYTVTVAEKGVDIGKQSCGQTSVIKKIRDKKLFIAPVDTTFLCLGESVSLSSTGGISDWQWTTTGGGDVDNPTNASTDWTPNAEGTFKVAIEAMVPEGELVVNGDFEDGATGFEVSTGMREAPWGDVTTQTIPGCGTGPNLVFRNYGISGNGNGVYTVGNTAPLQDVWCFNGGVTDHTTGTGNFFMMDGLTGPGWEDLEFTDNYIWQQKLVVEKNVDYEFSAWFASLDVGGPTPPDVKLMVNGIEIPLTDPLNYSENWDEVVGEWNSGNYEGEITISIFNATNADGGNDFAMDDVSFSSGNALQSDTTVVVVEECIDPCVQPTSVAFADDSLKICDEVNYSLTATVVEDASPLEDYYYSWYKDGTEIVSPTTTVTVSNDGVGDLATSSGWYKIRVEDGNNSNDQCYLEDSIYLGVYPIPEPNLGNDTTLCFGESLDLDAGAGPGPGVSTYLWTPNGETTQTINADASGTYGVTITTSIGCEETDEIEITINPEVTVDLGPNDTICDNDNVVLDAGAGWDSYAWLPGGETTQTKSVNTTGDYEVTVADNIGCEAKDTILIEVYGFPTVDLGDDITVCEGPVDLDAGNSVVGQTYLWNTLATTQTIQVNENGTNEYFVTATNWQCEDSDTILVTIDSVLNVNFGPDTTVCENLLPVDLIGDPGYASYKWMDDSDTELGTAQTYSALAAGEYRVEVIDPAGCVGFDTINVFTNPLPDATINNGIDTITICPTSPAVTLTAEQAGATYDWTPTNETTQSISNNAEGWYSVEVDVAGCKDVDSIYILVSDQLIVDIGDDQVICPGIEAKFYTAFSGYNHDWNDGESALDTFETSNAGMVTVYVTDPGGCEGWDTAFVTVDNPLQISLGPDRGICVDHDNELFEMVSGRTDVTVIGWDNGSTDFIKSTNTDGEHWLEVDSAGCLARDTVVLTVHDLPIIDLGPDTFICKGTGEIIPLDAGAGFTNYLWQKAGTGNTQNIQVTDSGEYKAVVTDNNGCVNADSVYIDQKDATLFELFGGKEDTIICPLGSALIGLPDEVVNANNPVYTWTLDNTQSNGVNVTVDGRADGDDVGVHLNLINEFGCISEDTFTVKVRNYLAMHLFDQEVCDGDNVEFDSEYPLTGYTFEWNNDPALNSNVLTFNPASIDDEGTISLSVISDEGCSGDTTVELVVNPLPAPVLTDQTICEGESAIFDHGVANVANSLWRPTNETTHTVTGNSNTDYKVIVTDVNGCIDSTEASLIVNLLPVFTVTQMPDEACEGEDIDLSTGLGNTYSFLWAPNNENTSDITVSVNGLYSVVVTDTATGCYSPGEKEVVFKPFPVAIIEPDVDTAHLCAGEQVNLIPNLTVYDVSWRNVETGEAYGPGNVNVNSNGTYILNVDNQGCDAEDTIYVEVHELPEAPLGNDTVVCFLEEDSIVIDAGRIEGTFLWNTGSVNPAITVGEQGTFVVNITNNWGCSIEDDLFVDDDCPHGIYLPNAFTPNGDGLNDVFEVKGYNLLSVEVYVFDRWGMHIWTGATIGSTWDGTYLGREAQIDVYVWKMIYSYESSDEKVVKKQRVGTVSLIR